MYLPYLIFAMCFVVCFIVMLSYPVEMTGKNLDEKEVLEIKKDE